MIGERFTAVKTALVAYISALKGLSFTLTGLFYKAHSRLNNYAVWLGFSAFLGYSQYVNPIKPTLVECYTETGNAHQS